MAYLTVQDVRDEGVSVAQASDARITATIALVSTKAEHAARTWWESREKTLTLDAPDHDRVSLPYPCISLESVTLDETELSLDDDAYLRVDPITGLGLVLARVNGASFGGGRDKLVITGTFGHVENADTDPTTPADIKWALTRWTILMLPTLTDEDSIRERRFLTAHSESVDGRSRSRQASNSILSGDPEVDRIIVSYRRPRAAIV